MEPDLAGLRVALERQALMLAPIAHRLRLGVVHPPVAPHDWNGPASVSFGALENRLRHAIRLAADATDEALHATRIAVAQVTRLQQVVVPDV
jgi:hypothetical protein